MQLLSLSGSMLAGGADTLGGGSGPALLAAFSGASTPVLILSFLIIVFVSIPVVSFPTWIASKILAPESATYRRAIIANVLHVLAAIGLLIVAAFLQGLAGADSARALLVVLGMILLSVSIHIMIPAKVYEIGAWNAIGLNIVSSFITLAIGAAIFAGAVGVVGFANVTAPLASYREQIQQVQKTANLPDLPSISSIPLFSSAPPTPAPPPPPTDYTVEIDSLLNTALHPADGRPSLTERENMVRSLQQKIRAQRNMLPPGDAHAALVYQNQYHRYLLLLDSVKAERKAHPLSEEMADRQATPP